MRFISLVSVSVGMRPDFAASNPIAHTITGAIGTNGSRFTPFGWRSMLSRNSGYVTQSHGSPAFIEAYGIASVRVIVSIARSRKSGLTGAKPKPQLPITSEVTPCQLEIEQYGSQKSCAS